MLLPINGRWYFFVLASLAASVSAQSLKIPDFRQPAVAESTRVTGPCDNCGEIRSIREIHSKRDMTVPQAFTPMPRRRRGQPESGRSGDRARWGPAGEPVCRRRRAPEMRERFAETTYEITVRLDSGAYSYLERRDSGHFRSATGCAGTGHDRTGGTLRVEER
jgi:hypothetical protein